MKQDLDISNIESKPTVVLVSNQSEFDQLMQHLEKEGKVWAFGDTKPTKFQHLGHDIEFPYCIVIHKKEIAWCDILGPIDNAIEVSFSEYAAKHIKTNCEPHWVLGESARLLKGIKGLKKGRVGIYAGDVEGSAMVSFGSKDIEVPYDIIEHHSIWAKPKSTKRDRIRIERKKYDELVAEVERLQQANSDKAKRLEEIAGICLNTKESFQLIESENHKLKVQNETLKFEKQTLYQRYYSVKAERDILVNKSAELAHLDTLARTIRDQRDMARFIAALLLIVSVGFSVAVWFGALIPKI